MSAPPVTAFRFDEATHAYTHAETGEAYPSVTQLLKRAGLIDTTFLTPEGRARGTAVHELCAAYDNGLVRRHEVVSRYRGWFLAYLRMLDLIRPEILTVEQAAIHPVLRFGGRPDRTIKMQGITGVLEIKTGAKAKSDPIQTALQVILLTHDHPLPFNAWGRYVVYVKENGKFSLEEHRLRADFDEAYRILRRFTS